MAKNFTFKAANMRTEQEFILYPYSGGDQIQLQSDKRFCIVNLRTGKGIINAKNENYANSIKLAINPLQMELPEETKTAIQSYLWHNEGKDGNINGCLSFENKQLFSK